MATATPATIANSGINYPGLNLTAPQTATPAATPAVAAPPVTPTGGNAVVAPNNTAVAYSFLDGSGYNSQGQQIKAPTVITAKAATDDLAKKQADLTTATTAMGNQAQIVAANNATNKANQVAASNQVKPLTMDDINKAVGSGYDYASIGLQPNPPNGAQLDATIAPQGYKFMYDSAGNKVQVPESPVDQTNDDLKAVQAKQDAAYQTFANQIQQIQNGTFPLTTDQQAQVNSLQAQFDQLKQQQALANQNYTGGVTNAGIASGRNRYAPEIELGNIQAAVSSGIAKIAAIDVQASSAISQLRQGFMSDNYELINSAYQAANQAFSQKSDTIQKMSENVRVATQDALTQHQREIENQRAEDDRTTAAIKFAAENDITKPYYLIGKTAIDTKTGMPISYQEYLRATGQPQDTPENKADWSQIQASFTTPAAKQLAQQQSQYEQTFAENQRQFNATQAQNERHFNAEHPSNGDSTVPVLTGNPEIDAAVFKQNSLQNAGDIQTVQSNYQSITGILNKLGTQVGKKITPNNVTEDDLKYLTTTDQETIGKALARIQNPDLARVPGDSTNALGATGFWNQSGQFIHAQIHGQKYKSSDVLDAIKTATSLVDTRSKTGSSQVTDNKATTTVMTGSQGTFNVPNDQIELFKKNGYK